MTRPSVSEPGIVRSPELRARSSGPGPSWALLFLVSPRASSCSRAFPCCSRSPGLTPLAQQASPSFRICSQTLSQPGHPHLGLPMRGTKTLSEQGDLCSFQSFLRELISFLHGCSLYRGLGHRPGALARGQCLLLILIEAAICPQGAPSSD